MYEVKIEKKETGTEGVFESDHITNFRTQNLSHTVTHLESDVITDGCSGTRLMIRTPNRTKQRFEVNYPIS